MLRKRWRAVALALAILAMLFAAWMISRRVFGREEARVAELTVAEIRGEVRVSSARGVRSVAAGEMLYPDDVVRTGPDGLVSLRTSDGSRVTLEGHTEFQIGSLTRSLTRFRLERGLVAADVVASRDRTFRVETAEAGTRAETSGGRFEVARDESGAVAVAAREGDVTVSGAGGEVRLRAGQQTRVLPGRQPDAPRDIPASVFLKVRWPDEVLGRRRAVVQGEATPGALVRVGDAVARTDENGRFSVPVDLHAGENRLTVSARLVGAGEEQANSPSIVVDERSPEVRAHPEKLWRGADGPRR